MSQLKERLEQAAQARAQKAKELIATAQELHTEGKISTDTLTRVTNRAENGYPYAAQEDLETILARNMLEEDSLTNSLSTAA